MYRCFFTKTTIFRNSTSRNRSVSVAFNICAASGVGPKDTVDVSVTISDGCSSALRGTVVVVVVSPLVEEFATDIVDKDYEESELEPQWSEVEAGLKLLEQMECYKNWMVVVAKGCCDLFSLTFLENVHFVTVLMENLYFERVLRVKSHYKNTIKKKLYLFHYTNYNFHILIVGKSKH
ncbi:hypothetical protein AGLY_016015 [Aphis glycines]|uniref:Uncharacterized protein n=1 Tax=Aphis glycines TaxID=307491 RepID=A0A6G0SYL5_APHGL|nr:hypothetical protein AGLY_016015 [Aphis glycines]